MTPDVVHVLKSIMIGANRSASHSAVIALADFAETDSEILDYLLKELRSGNEDIQWMIAQAFESIKKDEILDPLLSALNDKSSMVRDRAAFSLGRVRQPTPEVLKL